MKLSEIMAREVEVIHPDDNLLTAARKMRDHDIGFLPVFDGNELIGVLSDRDLIVRGLAEDMNPKMKVGRTLMTAPVICCFDDDSVEDAARLMYDKQIRRLVVLNRINNQMTGVISLGDLAVNVDDKISGEVLGSISVP